MNRRFSGFPSLRAGGILLLLLFFLPGLALAGDNLLENGSFEETDGEGLPLGWYTDAYLMDEGFSIFATEEEAAAPDGARVASIRNIASNDARFAQIVEVEPESLYRFSGYIRGEGIEEGRGANLSLEGLYVFSRSVYDTDGEWQRIEWYGETGENQTEVVLYARLGGYSGESKGKAWFDGLSLEKVDAVPGEGIADLWYKETDYSVYDDTADEEENEGEGNPAWPLLILIALIYSFAAAMILRRKEESPDLTEKQSRGPSLYLVLSLGAAMVLRLVLAWRITGYMVDVNCFTSWGRTMAQYGPLGFYGGTGFCDYPPLYMYVLGLNSLVQSWLGVTDPGWTRVIFRFIPCLCDIIGCAVICSFARRRNPDMSRQKAEVFAVLLALNPVLILNSAAWGQMDSVLCLCMLGVAIWAMEGKWHFALPLFMLGVLIKPQALMLGFLGLAAVILVWIREPESRKSILKGLGGTAAAALIGILPFGIRQQPGWLLTRYADTLSSYPYATVNTANFYYLLGGNWSKIETQAHLAAPLILAAACLLYCVVWTLRYRREGHRRLWIEQGLTAAFAVFFIVCAVTGASWGTVGAGAMAYAFLIVLSLYIRKGDISFLPLLGALLFILLYVFGVKMHERYIFPAFLLLGCAWFIHRDRRILTVLLAMSAATFLNEGIVLDNSIRLGSSMGHLNNDTRVLAQILSCVQILNALYATHIALDLGLKEKPERTVYRLYPEAKKDNTLHWKKRDSMLLAGLLAVYSLITFTTLGSAKAPQTAWTSTDYEENVILDLGEEQDAFVMLYFARVSRYDFSVQTSSDGENWSPETWAEMAQGQCWKWKYATEYFEADNGTRSYNSGSRHWFDGRYVKITAHQVGLALCEVIFRDPDGKILPVKVVGRSNASADSPLYSDPACLTDEQDSMEALPLYFRDPAGEDAGEESLKVAQPSWWNSTYFDEIYHARTAWEFLNHSTPYETTHPPLGKILMSWGVALFGMTPFGWRFAGALAGVAMLAGMYLLGKQLTKSTLIAGLMGGLMALDCMHLTQTQIATIDSFPVLFILFSFFFMLRFIQSDPGETPKKRMLTDLGCSGLFIGLAIASKWIGLYAGAGLAVLYFLHCEAWMGRMAREGREAARAASRRFLILCCWCLLFFVAVPVTIYLLSYIPYFSYKPFTGIGNYLKDVINSQTGMYNYHSTPGLGMDHPFYSPWYEWPVIGKPMFYATKQYVFAEGFSHSIFCIGNPVIWFTAIGTMIFAAAAWLQNRAGAGRLIPERDRDGSNLLFLICGFLAQYLPWILVPRGTYIYHYFASVPFLIVSLGLAVYRLRQWNRRAGTWAGALLLGLAAAAFLLFFPYATGILAPTWWLDLGRGLLKIWY